MTTLDEAMALAVLKGDRVAALMLADKLLEGARESGGPAAEIAALVAARAPSRAASSWEVWRWPEFRAFCARLGVALALDARSLTIHLPVEGVVSVTQEYLGADLTPGGE